jgi:hypothetical protein
MNVHAQYPKGPFFAKRVIVTCARCGVEELAYVRGQGRPKLCSVHSAPVKSAKAIAA